MSYSCRIFCHHSFLLIEFGIFSPFQSVLVILLLGLQLSFLYCRSISYKLLYFFYYPSGLTTARFLTLDFSQYFVHTFEVRTQNLTGHCISLQTHGSLYFVIMMYFVFIHYPVSSYIFQVNPIMHKPLTFCTLLRL